jgi:hypothetical protein
LETAPGSQWLKTRPPVRGQPAADGTIFAVAVEQPETLAGDLLIQVSANTTVGFFWDSTGGTNNFVIFPYGCNIIFTRLQ